MHTHTLIIPEQIPSIKEDIDTVVASFAGTQEQRLALIQQRLMLDCEFGNYMTMAYPNDYKKSKKIWIENVVKQYIGDLPGESLGNAFLECLNSESFFLKRTLSNLMIFLEHSPVEIPFSVITKDILFAVLNNNRRAIKNIIDSKNFDQDRLLQSFVCAFLTNLPAIDLLIPEVRKIKDLNKYSDSSLTMLLMTPSLEALKPGQPSVTSHFIECLQKAQPDTELIVVTVQSDERELEFFLSDGEILFPTTIQTSVSHTFLESTAALLNNKAIVRSIIFSNIIFDRFKDLDEEDIPIYAFEALNTSYLKGEHYLDSYDFFIKNRNRFEHIFTQDPSTLHISHANRVHLTSMALLTNHRSSAKKLIAEAATFDLFPDQKRLIFVSGSPENTYGNISAASQAISIMQQAYPDRKMTWFILTPTGQIPIPSLIPPNIEVIHVGNADNFMSQYDTHPRILELLMYYDTTIIVYPSSQSTKWAPLFPRVTILNIGEYEESLEDSMQLQPITTNFKASGVSADALGVFICEQPKSLAQRISAFESPLLSRLLVHNRENVFFGYFQGSLYSHSCSLRPKDLVLMAILKSIHNHQSVRLDGSKTSNLMVTIVAPFKQEHLPEIKDILEKISRGEIKGLKEESIILQSFEWHDKVEIELIAYNQVGVLLQLINPFPLAHGDMLRLMVESDPLCMLTGDSSFIEGIEACKVILYQIMGHKQDFYKAMHEVLEQLPKQKQAPVDLERYNVKKLIEEQKYFLSLHSELTDPSIQDRLQHLAQKGLDYLKPLYFFMVLQKVKIHDEKDKIQQITLLARLAIDYQDVLQEGMRSLKAYLLERKNLHIAFPRYIHAKKTSPVYSPLYTRHQMQNLWSIPQNQAIDDRRKAMVTGHNKKKISIMF